MEQLKDLNLSSIDLGDGKIGQTLRFLLNAVEELIGENQQLRDEINRLKGGPARPTIRPQKKGDECFTMMPMLVSRAL